MVKVTVKREHERPGFGKPVEYEAETIDDLFKIVDKEKSSLIVTSKKEIKIKD